MKFAMCNEFCEGWGFERVCQLAAAVGYDGVEIAPMTIDDDLRNVSRDERRRLREVAQQHGLEVIGLHWLLVKPEGLQLNSPNEPVRHETVDYLHAEVDFCADVGGEVLVFGSPKQRNVPDGESYERVWDRSVAVCRDLAQHAAQRGVTFCIEPLGKDETNFIRTAEEARRLVDAVDKPGFKMILDVKAMSQESKPVPQIIRESKGYVRHFHANDANREGPGFGETDFHPIADALRDIGYDGYVSVEVFDFSPGPETIAHKSLQYLREVFC